MRIHELTLATRDIAGQSAFWGETLGLQVREHGDGAIDVSLQASTIRFEQSSRVTDPRYHFAINVRARRSRRLRYGLKGGTGPQTLRST
jgi:catechol-2,3-dioxygenase